MKIVSDKYGRNWLLRYGTFVLLNINHTGIVAQSSIIAAGNQTETIGEVFPIMQTIQKESVPLNVPRFEVPIEKPIIKKKLTFWQKILKLFNF